MKTFHQFVEQARSVRVPLHPFYTMPSNNKGDTLRLLKKDIPPIWDDPLAKKPKKFGKDSKINPKVLERSEIRDQIFTGKANLDKKA
tara:strand:+ start:378 stop:638 length:261 start_codon:yes stop_codon:yes gene_type:complete